jgi:hypothetical protein
MIRMLSGFVLLVTLLLGLGGAQQGNEKLSPGDRIEVDWAGQRCQGEFISYSPSGWLNIKFLFMGVEISPTLPPEKVRVLGGGGGGVENAVKRPLRAWTDATGKFKQKARFVKLDGDELTLETEAGKTITMSLEKLSEADQAMARKIAAKAGPKSSGDRDDNPFAGKADPDARPGSPAADGPGMDQAGGDPAAVEVSTGNWRGRRKVTVDPQGAWSVTVDGAAFPEKLATKPIPLPGPPQGSDAFFEKIDGLFMGPGVGRACVRIVDSSPAKPRKSTLSVVDLVRGEVKDPVILPARMSLADVDRSCEFVLTLPDNIAVPGVLGPPPPSLGVWRIDGGSVEPVRVWNPQDPDNAHTGAPTSARFIDADHVFCVAFPGKLSVWHAPEARAIWSIDIAPGTSPAVSPGGKYLAATVGDRICLFDALTGKTAGCLAAVPGAVGNLSFRPDGAQLAMLSSQRLVVWDLQSGEVYRDFSFAAVPAGSVDWLFGGYVLCGGTSLVDLERRAVIWKYLADGHTGVPGGWGEIGGQFWYALQADGSRGRALYPASLPQDDVTRVVTGLDPEHLLAVRPGASFTLDVRVQGDAGEQQKVQQGLAERLAAAGMTIGQGGALVLQATTETGKSREMSYRAFGRLRGEAEKVTVTDQISRLRILEQGKPIWEQVVAGGAPAFLQIKEGQSLQEALAPYQKPNLQYFSEVNLPQYVARPAEDGAYGFSKLTPQGVVNTPPPAKAAGN